MIFIIYKLSKIDLENNFLLIAIFASVWFFTPVFGRVVLWLDGACNYLWPVFFDLLFLIPFILFFLEKPVKTGGVLKALFLLFSFIAGALSENTSFAFIFMAVLFLFSARIVKKRKISFYLIMCVIAACLGYLSIYLAPAMKNNHTTFTVLYFRKNFFSALWLLNHYCKTLLVVFAILLALSYTQKIDKERIIISLIFFLGAVFANFIMIFARYYPDRRVMCTAILLIVSDSILASALFEAQSWTKSIVSCFIAVLLINLSLQMPTDLDDIYFVGVNMFQNKAEILSCKENGQLDIEVLMPYSVTDYTVISHAIYLKTETGSVWPNANMARYYGVNSIIGYK